MSDTPTAALVEEADLDRLTDVIELGAGLADVSHDVARALDESCPHCAYDCMDLPTRVEHGNWRCQRRAHVYPVVPQKWLGAIREVREDRQQKRQEAQERADYAAALCRAEAERDESRRDAEAYKRQTQEVSAKAIELTKEVSAKLDQVEAERDAQRAEVLRLTGERDAARDALAQKHLSERQSVRYVIACRDGRIAELLKTIEELRAQVWGLICAGSNMAERKRYFQGLWETLLADGLKRDAQLSELTATRDLLTAENARLQARVATLELLLRGGK